MRRAVLASVMVAAVIAAAQPAGANDDGFRGRYRLIARQARSGACGPLASYRREVHVRSLGDWFRQFARPDAKGPMVFRYRSEDRFPWQHTHNLYGGFKLRYDPATDSAEGVKYRRHLGRRRSRCRWRVRLVPIG